MTTTYHCPRCRQDLTIQGFLPARTSTTVCDHCGAHIRHSVWSIASSWAGFVGMLGAAIGIIVGIIYGITNPADMGPVMAAFMGGLIGLFGGGFLAGVAGSVIGFFVGVSVGAEWDNPEL